MEIKTTRLTLFTIDKKQMKVFDHQMITLSPIIKKIIKKHLRLYKKYDELMKWSIWGIRLNTTEEVIGKVGFHGMPDEKGVLDLGYEIYEPFRRQNYCYESVMALIEYVFKYDLVNNIQADCEKKNIASSKVLTKCGFRCYHEDHKKIYFQYSKK
jgi:RimJ/RimL family protein N-acetyltransferase